MRRHGRYYVSEAPTTNLIKSRMLVRWISAIALNIVVIGCMLVGHIHRIKELQVAVVFCCWVYFATILMAIGGVITRSEPLTTPVRKPLLSFHQGLAFAILLGSLFAATGYVETGIMIVLAYFLSEALKGYINDEVKRNGS